MGFSKSDWTLIFFGLLLVASSSYFYFLDISPRVYLANFFPGLRPKNLNEAVGILRVASGSVRRQQAGKAEFERIGEGAILYNSDTLVTSKEGGATAQLEDGGKIELGPDTMIRLQFESRVSLEGITRFATLDLVSGEIKNNTKGSTTLRTSQGEVVNIASNSEQKVKVEKVIVVRPTAPPIAQTTVIDAKSGIELPRMGEEASRVADVQPKVTPSPSPMIALLIELRKPVQGSKFFVEKGAQKPIVPIGIELESNRINIPVKLLMTRQKSKMNPKGVESIFEKTQTLESTISRTSFEVDRPGIYSLDVLSQDQLKNTQFEVLPEFEGIKLLPPLVGGSTTASNEYTGNPVKDFEIVLRWEAYPEVKEYFIEIMDAENEKKVLLRRKVLSPEYRFNKNVVFKGKFKYGVSSATKSGFRPVSKREVFEFAFLPPALTQPLEGAKVNSRGSI